MAAGIRRVNDGILLLERKIIANVVDENKMEFVRPCSTDRNLGFNFGSTRWRSLIASYVNG